MFPLLTDLATLNAMNRQLSDIQIRRTYRDLSQSSNRVSGRQLCAELRRRFGAVGKTERVFAIWRAEVVSGLPPPAPPLAPDVEDLMRRVATAEAAATEACARAERAEAREESHQSMWAMKVDELRQALKAYGPVRPPISSDRSNVIVGPGGRVHTRQLLGGRGQIIIDYEDLDTSHAIKEALKTILASTHASPGED